jgi:uncharacterized protein (DUF1810 family)
VCAELRAGRKRSHWMWFIFPQLRGLGHSATARFYVIVSLGEARAYLADPVLGSRLDRCTRLVLETEDASLRQIFGTPDDLKFGSSMTLFALASGRTGTPFRAALDRFGAGRMNEATLRLLREGEDG